jgi:hypothetical protein
MARRHNDDDLPSGEESNESPSEESGGKAPPPPLPSPDELAEDIEFSVGRLSEESPLAVTVANGPIGKSFAPADLIGKLAAGIAALVKDVAGSETMLYGVAPGNSMTLYFGDPKQINAQAELPLGATQAAAERIADFVETVDASFDARARAVGPPMRRYDEIARLVVNEGLTLDWQPRGGAPKRLTPQIASEQHDRLKRPPEMVEWEIPVNGYLYRLIAEPGATSGAAGIHRFDWSDAPKDFGPRVIATAGMGILDNALEKGLFRKPVKARLLIRRPKPGQIAALDQGGKEWLSIEPGEPESSAYGMTIDDLLDDPDA